MWIDWVGILFGATVAFYLLYIKSWLIVTSTVVDNMIDNITSGKNSLSIEHIERHQENEKCFLFLALVGTVSLLAHTLN